jgi:signal transduction histidine kinase
VAHHENGGRDAELAGGGEVVVGMTSPDAIVEPVAAERSPPTRVGRPLVRAVARLPWKVRTKLLVAFVGIVALFALSGGLGVRALGQSEARVERLGTLELRASAYSELETGSAQLRQLLALRAGGTSWNRFLGRQASAQPGRRSLTLLDRTIAATLLQFGPATSESNFGFVPPSEDEAALARIRRDHRRLTNVMRRIIALDQAGAANRGRALQHASAEPLANELTLLTDQLSSSTREETTALIAQNRSAYAGSRNLFIGAGAVSVALALLLGFVLAWSVVRPIQQTDARLAEIAAGDFSRHVDVPNRDELGTLAANLNSMNDELKRLYEALEEQAAELTDLNRTLESRVAEQTEELRASRGRVVSAADAERRRIERDLHDGAQQHLIGLAVHLRLVRDLGDSDPNAAREMLDALGADVQETLEQVRDLAHGIYPPLLQDRGLADALAAAAGRATIPTRVDASRTGRYDPVVEATVYFCCLEALQNAAKHAGEGASAVIAVREDDGGLLFEVVDDGAGFDASDARGGVGLTNMRDRVGAVGGTVRLESTVGGGTTLAGLIPLGDQLWP